MVKRIVGLVLVVLLLTPALSHAQATPGAATPSTLQLPPGVPKSATIATVHRVVDGDKFYVRMPNDELDQVLLAGVDAPENGECYFAESKAWLTTLLSKGAVVYLEQSGTADRAGHVIVRYVWLPGADGQKATLVNTKIVREGYAVFDPTYDAPKYYDRMKEYHLDAHEQGKGLWGACGGVHEVIPAPTPEPTQTPSPTPTAPPAATPLSYSVVDSDENSVGGRERWSYRIVVDGADSASDDQVMATMVAALESAFSDHPGAKAVVVFAYRPDTDTESLFSLARAAASRDGKGWNGEGDIIIRNFDNGKAVIEIVDWDATYGLPMNNRVVEAEIR